MDNQNSEKPAESQASIVSEFHARISALEAANVELRAELEAAKASGTVALDTAHVQHVMTKHFFHDRPDADDASRKGSG